METAAKILIVGGVANLAYGLLTGFAVARARMSSPEAPKYLMLAHTGTLMQGVMLLGLTLALSLSDVSRGAETLAAWFLVASTASLGLADTLNWRRGVRDEFVEKPATFQLKTLASILSVGGIGIILAGVVRGV